MSKFNRFFVIIYVIIYLTCSVFLFYNTYKYSVNVVDEFFHIPQGIAYCEGNFSHWDDKITTLPGLYIYSTVLLYPFQLCTGFWLRVTNLLASWINVLLFYKLISSSSSTNQWTWTTTLRITNLAIFPPLYFFANVYYTDTFALTMVLCVILFAKQERHILAGVFGALSVLVRQTNIIWVAAIFGEMLLNKVLAKLTNQSRKQQKLYNLKDILNALTSIVRFNYPMSKVTLKDIRDLTPYIAIMTAFLAFLKINGSIVVGDKSAHQAQLHIPQLFYFCLFYLTFQWPYCLKHIRPFLHAIIRHKFVSCLCLVIAITIVHYNTLIHNYLLADNRHYTFYVWNRFFGRYACARYIITPVYCFGVYCIAREMSHVTISFVLPHVVGGILVMVLQKMIDVRYFIMPFVIWRLMAVRAHRNEVILEFLTYFVINVASFYVFFTKRIYWEDFNCIQGVMW